MTLRPRASAPSGLTGFRFGLAEEERPAPRQAAMASFTLDEAGRHTETVALAEVPDTSHPLEAVLQRYRHDPHALARREGLRAAYLPAFSMDKRPGPAFDHAGDRTRDSVTIFQNNFISRYRATKK